MNKRSSLAGLIFDNYQEQNQTLELRITPWEVTKCSVDYASAAALFSENLKQ
jgi:hypothetical protein